MNKFSEVHFLYHVSYSTETEKGLSDFFETPRTKRTLNLEAILSSHHHNAFHSIDKYSTVFHSGNCFAKLKRQNTKTMECLHFLFRLSGSWSIRIHSSSLGKNESVMSREVVSDMYLGGKSSIHIIIWNFNSVHDIV